ncbi:hypothetical protein D8674_021620 [Pyrus ussuriensis x Pyrus communis]|uniref:Uncharacterized protein n=1 Tax=Pyrus ussuriensis x Pyrus communis TaxID=2448454 RepID=A0A5N5GN21_9ROSA|nr:hypothetical protein D8674_021620 [Pyrus ussuriensis x Pyrus communis]
MPKPIICSLKLTPKHSVFPSSLIVVPQPQFVSSSLSYFTATSSAYSPDVAAKMSTAYDGCSIYCQRKKVASFETLNLSSFPIPWLSISAEEDLKENLEENLEEDLAEETEANGFPLHSIASSQSEKF